MARLNMVQPLYLCYDSSWKGKTCPTEVVASQFEHIHVCRKFIQKKASYTCLRYLKGRLQASRLLFQLSLSGFVSDLEDTWKNNR